MLPVRSRRAVRQRRRVWAQKCVNDLFCYYTWLEFGSPDMADHYIPLRGFSDNPLVRTRANELLGDFQRFGCSRVDKHIPFDRGRKELSKAVHSFRMHDYFHETVPSVSILLLQFL